MGHGGGRREILQQPKIYRFDTSFVSFARSWDSLRELDRGLLWEHFVLETLLAGQSPRGVWTWRDKDRHEVDFVLPGPGGRCDAVECKLDAGEHSTKALARFRSLHPKGRNYVISPQVDPAYVREREGLAIVYCNLGQWESGEATGLGDEDLSKPSG